MIQEPKVHIIEIIKDNKEKGGLLLKMYAIVQTPYLNETMIIYFDNFFMPSFQGLNNYDIFPDYEEAFKYIKCANQADDIKIEEKTAIAIAGLINNTYLILIEKAEPIKFRNQEIIYKIQSLQKILLKKEKTRQDKFESIQCADNFYYSFNSDILSFHEKKNNNNYNYFHLNQKPFRHLRINICPFVINGYVIQEKISDNSEILLIGRRSRFSDEITSGINNDGIVRNQTEIEMIISEQKIVGNEISFFTATFSDIPIFYKISDIKNTISYEIDDNSFIDTPKLIFNLLGNRKEKMNDNIFLIDATQQQQSTIQYKKNCLDVTMRQMVSYLSGVFHVDHIKVDIDTKIDESEIIQKVYSSLPNIKMRKQLFFEEQIYNLNDTDQIFYICSDYKNLNAEFILIILLSKAFKSVFHDYPDSENYMFSLISPFLKKFVNSNKNNLPFLKKIVEVQSNKFIEVENYSPPENIDRCVSLFPTSTIVSPYYVDHRILSPFKTLALYKTPDEPIIINLTETCRVSRILFMPANDTVQGNIYNISPSMVSIYGGLYLNQMFPIVENLALSPTVETPFRVNLKENDRYSTDLNYSQYGKIRFISFKFQSLFKSFYISNIYVFTDGSKAIEIPKNIKKENFSLLDVYQHQNIKNEAQRIENLESLQQYAFKNHDKIQDLIDVDSYFSNQHSKKNDQFNLVNDNLMKNELIMTYKKYPFLCNKFKLKDNFMKYYYSSIYIPYLVASSPPLFEYIINQHPGLEDFKYFQPKESIVIIRLVFLQSYPIELIEVLCNNPLFIEVLSSDFKFANLFLPPGGEQFFAYNNRVIDLKLKGNPINISFLGFKSNNKVSYEIDNLQMDEQEEDTENIDQKKENEIDEDLIVKCQQKDIVISDSKIDIKDPSAKIIGIKLNRKYFADYIPRYFLFDNEPLLVKMNPSSTFFFPKIISCKTIKIFFKGMTQNQRMLSDAVIIELQQNQGNNESQVSIEEKLSRNPHLIQISGNYSFMPLKYLEYLRVHT